MIIFPDAEAAVLHALRQRGALPGVTLGTSLPADLAEALPFLMLRRSGGVPVLRYRLDEARIDVEAWATSREAAQDLAQQARAAIHDLPGWNDQAAVVLAVDDEAGLMWLPDPDTDLARWLFVLRVLLRPA